MVLDVLIILAAGYLLGNLNGAVLMSHLIAHEDVRTKGSGNAGLTNFYRNYGGLGTLAVIAIDAGKAVLSCFLGKWLLGAQGYAPEGMMLGALAVSLGHDFPVFLGFRGGKGIVCGAACALAVDPKCFLVLFAIFCVLFAITKYVSLGSLVVSVGFGIYFAIVYRTRPWAVLISLLTAALAIFMHRSNIGRLLRGEERKTYLRKKRQEGST